MPALIPDATLGATFTNDITGVTYTYDGQKWVAEGGGGPHDHDEYVSKSGDTMTGRLNVYPSSGTMPSAEFRPSPDAPNERAVIYTKDKNNYLGFYVTAEGAPRAGRDISNPYIAKDVRDLTTKKYVDSTIQIQASFSYVWGGYGYTKPTNEEEAALEVGKMFAVNSHPTSQIRMHWEDSEGKLLCLPTSQGQKAVAGGKLFIFDVEPDDPEFKNPTKAKAALPDGRKLYTSRVISFIDKDDNAGIGDSKRILPIYRINLEDDLPEIPLNKKLIIQFGGILL